MYTHGVRRERSRRRRRYPRAMIRKTLDICGYGFPPRAARGRNNNNNNNNSPSAPRYTDRVRYDGGGGRACASFYHSEDRQQSHAVEFSSFYLLLPLQFNSTPMHIDGVAAAAVCREYCIRMATGFAEVYYITTCTVIPSMTFCTMKYFRFVDYTAPSAGVAFTYPTRHNTSLQPPVKRRRRRAGA